MDPASLTISVIGLASLFSACMGCFDSIQLGRAFGEDYGKCLLRLDAAKLRFSRWGEAAGIAPNSKARSTIVVPDKDFRLAQSLLEQIMESFEDAENFSRRYQRRSELESPTSEVLATCDERQSLRWRDFNLHSQLRKVASRRQQSTDFVQKTKWALYEKKRLDTMIGEITEFTYRLVELFPVVKKSQIPLCEMELSAIEDAQDLITLKTLAGPDDEVLRQSVEAKVKRRGHIIQNWSASDNADVWVGDENEYGAEGKGHHVSKFTVSGSAKVRLGNNNQGR